MKPIIHAQKLRKEFKRGEDKIVAVADIDLALEKGEVLGFLGPNGAGKTTTIKMLCGLLTPTQGSIWINGHELATKPRQALLGLGVVLEGNRNTYWRLTVAENLEYFAYIRGRAFSDLHQRINRLLESLELIEKRNDTVQTLSRGMQQKVSLACALIAEPDVLLLDEPTLGLDFQSSQAIQNEIRCLTREKGKTILLTTHQMEIAQSLVDRVAIIDRGHIIALDKLRNLLDLFALGAYEIRVNGHLALEQQTWLQRGWNVQADYDGYITKLSVTLKTEYDLYDAIKMLQPYKLPILSVQRAELNLGEIYLKLIEEGKDETTRLSA